MAAPPRKRPQSGAEPSPPWILRLCVSGMSRRSRQAIAAVRGICDQHLQGRCVLEVIDIYQQPELAVLHQVVATPTLIRERPEPLRHLLGDLSDIPAAVRWLGIETGAT